MILIDARKAKKRAAVVGCLVLIAAALLLAYRAIENNMLIDVDIQYKNYTGLNGSFSYRLPEGWTAVEQKFGENEILYHNDFTSGDRKLRGYVEIWNLNKPLINFINEGKKSAVGIISFKYYTIEPVKIDSREGYILQYSRRNDKNKYIKAFEVFIIDKDNRFSRFAFYMDESAWKDEYRDLFLSIAASANMKSSY